MARASRREFENVDKKALVGVARIKSQHSFVHVLLRTFALVARGQQSAGRIGSQASFQSSGLSVIMSVVHNDSPISVNVSRAFRHSVQDFRGAQVALGSDPVRDIVGTGPFGGSRVILVVKTGLNVLVQMFH